MRKIMIIVSCFLSYAALADDCKKSCEEAKSQSIRGCYYMQEACVRRFHRENDMQFCMERNLECVDRADEAKAACDLSCEETNCQGSCTSTGAYGTAHPGGMFHDRCYEIIDCATRTWDANINKCVIEGHEQHHRMMNCRDIPQA